MFWQLDNKLRERLVDELDNQLNDQLWVALSMKLQDLLWWQLKNMSCNWEFKAQLRDQFRKKFE